MTKKEIEKKIETLKKEKFLLEMKDHWTTEDFAKDAHLHATIKKFQMEIAKMG